MTVDKYYNIDDIVEVVDIIVGDDGAKSSQVKEILRTAATHIARKKRNSTITLKSPTADLVFGRERI